MRAYGADGQIQGVGDLVVRTLLLMIEDKNGSFDLAEAQELFIDRLLKLALFDLLLSVAAGMRQTLLPC